MFKAILPPQNRRHPEFTPRTHARQGSALTKVHSGKEAKRGPEVLEALAGVTAVDLPAGHMSVITRLAERDFVIGGDAMYMLGQLDKSVAEPPRPYDAHNFRRSLQELRLFRSQFPDAVITPGHDPDFYARIEQRYE
jgi:glyoxylase-like metal-dependent hydrolase (beta-lactamase superfamily II)